MKLESKGKEEKKKLLVWKIIYSSRWSLGSDKIKKLIKMEVIEQATKARQLWSERGRFDLMTLEVAQLQLVSSKVQVSLYLKGSQGY
jgi:hypothetical protein